MNYSSLQYQGQHLQQTQQPPHQLPYQQYQQEQQQQYQQSMPGFYQMPPRIYQQHHPHHQHHQISNDKQLISLTNSSPSIPSNMKQTTVPPPPSVLPPPAPEDTTTTVAASSGSPVSPDMTELPEHCRSLFLGDLSCFCTEEDIFKIFQKYGEIEAIRLMRGKEHKCLGYGFITFVDIHNAMNALEANGVVVVGRPIKLGWANMRNPTKPVMKIPASMKKHFMKGGNSEGPNNVAQVHFSFISRQIVQFVTEETIRSVFALFGEVKDIALKKHVVNQENNEQHGYGFIHFPLTQEGINHAIRAAQGVSQLLVNDVLYDSCITRSLEAFIRVHMPDHPVIPTLSSISKSNSISTTPSIFPVGSSSSSSLSSFSFASDDIENQFPNSRGMFHPNQSSPFAPSRQNYFGVANVPQHQHYHQTHQQVKFKGYGTQRTNNNFVPLSTLQVMTSFNYENSFKDAFLNMNDI